MPTALCAVVPPIPSSIPRGWFIGLAALGTFVVALTDRAPADDDNATRRYAAAAALQNRQVYDLAAEEWTRFLTSFPQDSRVDRAQLHRRDHPRPG